MEKVAELELDHTPRRPRCPQTIDIHVGHRIRLRRMLLGMSQENLAERLGLTFQQVQKYEKGLNRVSASRLFHLSEALGVEVQYFFDDLPAEDRPTDNGATEAGDTIADPASELHDFLRSHDGITLARVFSQIDNADVKRALIAQMQAIARRDRGT